MLRLTEQTLRPLEGISNGLVQPSPTGMRIEQPMFTIMNRQMNRRLPPFSLNAKDSFIQIRMEVNEMIVFPID